MKQQHRIKLIRLIFQPKQDKFNDRKPLTDENLKKKYKKIRLKNNFKKFIQSINNFMPLFASLLYFVTKKFSKMITNCQLTFLKTYFNYKN